MLFSAFVHELAAIKKAESNWMYIGMVVVFGEKHQPFYSISISC